ncbi:MAG: PQQ-binding-like beta-propeller repeat protein [Verrucomicrobiales bacterium]
MHCSILASLAVRLTAILGMVVNWTHVSAADRPQWGEAWSRNQVSAERGLPATFDGASGKNVRWSAALGTESHSTPVVAGGRVYVGTNNGEPRDPKRVGDRGVLLCLDERDGALHWQLVVPKRYEDPFFDWPGAGLCSSPTVADGRVYVVDNRGMVLCLDAEGLANGNDGPFVDEAAYYTPAGGSGPPRPPVEGADVRPEPGFQKPETAPDALGPLDADIVWMFDLVGAAGCWPHDSAHSSILIHGNHLYLNTSTGVDNTHRRNRAPDAPALVVLDKTTGRYLARESEGIARATFHCNWSAPAATTVGGEEVVLFIGGDGRLYGFAPLAATDKGEREGSGDGKPVSLKRVFRYDFDRDAPTDDIHTYVQNRREGPSNHYGMPVPVGESVYLAGGGDIFWGKSDAWVKRVDLVRRGAEIEPIERWAAPLNQHTLCTPTVADGLVFAADTARTVHCLDAETGRTLWSHDCRGAFWASAFVADGKVFIGSRSGDFWVFRAAREKEVLFETKLPDKLSATAVAANGVLYLTTMNRLYAVAETKDP